MTARLAAIALGIVAGLGCGGHAVTPPVSNPAERPVAAGAAPPSPVPPPATRLDRATPPRESLPTEAARTAPRDDDAPADVARTGDDDRRGTEGSGRTDASGAREADAPEATPSSEVHHVLRRGQTLYSLARLYGVSLADLMTANGIHDPRSVPAGTSLVIPGVRVSRSHHPAGSAAAEPDPGDASREHRNRDDTSEASIAGDLPQPRHAVSHRSGESLQWPLHGAITGPYGPRGKHRYHTGIDIDGDRGDAILAAASGVVVSAGIDGPYGRRVEIDHGHGTMTLYAHAERLLVHAGEHVKAGQPIAEVGRSGNARGTHLHFEVRRDGRAVDPMTFLRDGALLTAGGD